MFNNPQLDISSHLNAVDHMLKIGGKVSDDYKRTRANYEAFSSATPRSEEDALTALSESVASAPKGADFAALRLTALVELTAGDANRGRLESGLAAYILVALRNAYTATAASNYEHVAKAYSKAAKAITDAHNTVDMDGPTEAMLGAGKAETDAYLSAPLLVSRIEGALSDLVVAAALLGLEQTNTENGRIGLSVSTGTATPRQVWSAWQTTNGRTGRWGALLATGAVLRAADPAEYEPLSPERTERITIPSPNRGRARAFG